MKQSFFKSSVVLVLVTMLLANSSFALEILIHDSHGHESHGEMVVTETHGAEPVAMEDMSGDDCVCDEICCLSSVNFGNSGALAQALYATDHKTHRVDHYQSVFLDPYLEPPTT